MRVLLVWDENPERIRFYLIEDPSKHQLEMLEIANDKYINSDDDNEGMSFLNIAIEDGEYGNGEEHAGIWKENEVETPIGGPIDRVFHSGFVL